MNKHILQKELRTAGARAHELNDLIGLATELHILKSTSPSFWHRHKMVLTGAISTAVLILGILFYAQASLPGSMLYPIKRTSEQAILTVSPSYRGTVMMRRAQEVQKLVDAHADTATVVATLTDYQTEAALYKTGDASYAVYDSCTASLKTAALHARGAEQQAIKQTLYSLQNS